MRVVCRELWDVGYGLRVAGCRLRVADKKRHSAWGISHRVRHRSMEDTGGSKALQE